MPVILYDCTTACRRYTLIFMLAGNIFGVVLAEPNNGVGSAEWQYLAMLWVVCLAIRAAIVTLFYPVLDVLGSVNLFIVSNQSVCC